MDFTLGPDLERFRREVQAVLAATVDESVRRRVRSTGTHHDEGMASAMGARGWLRASVPGAAGTDPIRVHLLFSEMERVGAPYEALASNLLVAGLIHTFR